MSKVLATMQRSFMERRRKKPSYIVPIVFFLLEMLMLWLLMSLFNWNIDMSEWNVYTIIPSIIWIIFSSAKLYFIFKRQTHSYE